MSQDRIVIAVQTDGTVETIYDDALLSLFIALGGDVSTHRVSDVEPSPDGKGWIASLARVNGPDLGPFTTRREALDAEVQWLKTHRLATTRHGGGVAHE